MTSPAAHLLNKVKSLSGSNSVTVGKEIAGDSAITLYDTGGRDPIGALPLDCEHTHRPSVQVRIKDKSYASGYTKAMTIASGLPGYTNDAVSGIEQQGGIISLGENTTNQSIFTVNFKLQMR